MQGYLEKGIQARMAQGRSAYSSRWSLIRPLWRSGPLTVSRPPHTSPLSPFRTFRALSGRLKFTIRRYKFNKDVISSHREVLRGNLVLLAEVRLHDKLIVSGDTGLPLHT